MSKDRSVSRRSRLLPAAIIVFVAVVPVCGVVGPATAADWSSCEDDLDGLRRAASDANDVAESVKSAADDLESKRDDLESASSQLQLCTGDCWYERQRYRSARDDYRSAKDDYESATSDLRSELDTVGSRVRAVEASCEYPLASAAGARRSRPPVNKMCALFQRYKGRLPDAALIDSCKKSMSEEECRRCLGR